jgi:hypothetical protein
MTNSADKALHFRVLTRIQRSKEYHELKDTLGEARPNCESIVWCWESGSQVEEVVVFQFQFAPESPAANPVRK